MLTGVELAGLVLGSIPLLISAAEHRDVSLTPINVLLFGKKQAQKLSEVLEERRIGFRHCCEQMLSIAEIDFPAKYLLDTKGKAQLHQLWSDTNLAARLKSEFGDDFRIIELRLGEILASIQKLEKYIESNRLKRAFWGKSQAKDVDELRKQISRLQRFLDGEERSVVIGSIGNSWSSEITELQALRKHFLDAHCCIDSSWGCQCHLTHTLKFPVKLEAIRSSPWLVVAPTAASSAAQGSAATPWKSRAVQIRDAISPPSLPAIVVPSISNLCASLGNSTANPPTNVPNTTWKMLSGNAKKEYNLDQKDCPYPDASSLQMLSLQDALKSAPSNSPLSSSKSQLSAIPLRNRLELGAILLLAVLQHHSTEWLPATLDGKNVLLISQLGRLSREHIKVAFLQAGFGPPPAGNVANVTKPLFVRNLTLHNASILLIELAHGKTIAELMIDDEKREAQQAIGGQYARPRAAGRLSEELSDHVTMKSYCNAVDLCLLGKFGLDNKSKDLADDALYSAVYRHALKPLILELTAR